MNRFKYVTPVLMDNENTLSCENNVRLYDGDVKTHFEGGELIITTHRLLWGRPGAISKGQTCLGLVNELIVYIEEESPNAFSFRRSRKVLLHLAEHTNSDEDRPIPYSMYNFVKLSFKEGYSSDVIGTLNRCLQMRYWETHIPPQIQDVSSSTQLPQIKLRTGIIGIERSLQEKQKATDESLTAAFQDLNKLMTMAKDMVRLSQVISTKIKVIYKHITHLSIHIYILFVFCQHF